MLLLTCSTRGIPHTPAVTHGRAPTRFLRTLSQTVESRRMMMHSHVSVRRPLPPPLPSSLRKERIDAFGTAIMWASSTAAHSLARQDLTMVRNPHVHVQHLLTPNETHIDSLFNAPLLSVVYLMHDIKTCICKSRNDFTFIDVGAPNATATLFLSLYVKNGFWAWIWITLWTRTVISHKETLAWCNRMACHNQSWPDPRSEPHGGWKVFGSSEHLEYSPTFLMNRDCNCICLLLYCIYGYSLGVDFGLHAQKGLNSVM